MKVQNPLVNDDGGHSQKDQMCRQLMGNKNKLKYFTYHRAESDAKNDNDSHSQNDLAQPSCDGNLGGDGPQTFGCARAHLTHGQQEETDDDEGTDRVQDTHHDRPGKMYITT